MMNSNTQKPVVLVIAGHDPSGGAGIQADIETIAHAGCHAATVITSLTAQNTKEVADIIPQEPDAFQKQIQLIKDDMEISACKIGMIGSIELIEVIAKELSSLNIPVVLDPVLASTSGQAFADEKISEKILSSLLPLTTVITPNAEEIRSLTQITDLNEAAKKLLLLGANSVLLTGADEATEKVNNSFYSSENEAVEYQWQRLDGTYHGSGCTLSSRIAALLALGENLQTTVEKAQAYTWSTLEHGLKLGQGQAQPNHFFPSRFF
jgi:hydroxymethylpyrimidine/phosphomethylpyrimidine kinase